MILEVKDLANNTIGPLGFSLATQETLALSGPSGCGKSMLLRCLADLIPFTGTVTLFNKTVHSYTPVQWRKSVGLLPASSEWWHITIREHFAAGLQDEFITKQFSELGFTNDAWDWRVDQISSGEKQRLALLRLLQNKPDVLLLDEPTANLDAQSTSRVEDLLADYQQNRKCGIIWVSHDAEQIKRVSDRVLVMKKHGVLESSHD